MKSWISSLFLLLVIILCSVFFIKSLDPIDKISIYKMESFRAVDEDTKVIITNSKEIRSFGKAIRGAKRVPGVVNVVDPDYQVEFGDRSYYLWVEGDSGAIMNVNDTYTIFRLSNTSAQRIYEIIHDRPIEVTSP